MIKIADILSFLDRENILYEFKGDEDISIKGFSSLDQYENGKITWVKSEKNVPENFNTDAITLAVIQQGSNISVQNSIVTSESKRAFFSIIDNFFSKAEERPKIGQGTHISSRVKIGSNVKIGHNCTLDGDITIGDNTIIWDNVTILNKVDIGMNCIIQSGTRIGHDGYGYTEDEDHRKTMIKHYGGVTIEDSVYIGANVVIDRGTMLNTKVGKGSKIDALCFIAHNVVIGASSSLIAGSILYGSSVLGENVYIASAIVRNQVKVGNGSIVGIGSVVTKDVPPNTTVVGIPAKPLCIEKK